MQYRFEEFAFDVSHLELTHRGRRVHLEPQILSLLKFLLEHRAHAVHRNEIHEAIWGHRVVTDNALNVRIAALRKALGDDGRRQHLVETVARRGYQFVAPVEEVALPVDDDAPGRADCITIAVLPLKIRSSLDGSCFAERVTHALTDHLTRSRGIWVASRCTCFYQGPDADVREVGDRLGVRYVGSGWVHLNGRQARVSMALAIAATRQEIWSHAFDHPQGGFGQIDGNFAASMGDALVGAIRKRTRANRLPAQLPRQGGLRDIHQNLRVS